MPIDCRDLEKISKILEEVKPLCYKSRKCEFYNVACSFDIETTSFYTSENGELLNSKQYALLDPKDRYLYEKQAIMYIWQFGIDGYCIIGRTWYEFIDLLKYVSDKLDLYESRQLICYIHNLSFEFQFLKNWIKWNKIFATNVYEPLFALSEYGICFKCSYRLTGKSLDLLSKDLLKYKVRKKVGQLDYDKIRNSLTYMTEEEIDYCISDIKVVMCHIQEQIEIEKKIDFIPLTKTGYVRRDIKKSCLRGKSTKETRLKRFKYNEIIKRCTLSPAIYNMCLDALMGGYAHTNPIYSREIIHNAGSKDEISAYPAIMVGEMFPMSAFKFRKIESKEQLEIYLKHYACLMTIRLEDIRSIAPDDYIPRSKCHSIHGAEINNGRIHAADDLTITITEQDYFIIKDWYEIKGKISILKFATAYKGYLPTDFVKTILSYYKLKTILKGNKEQEQEYMLNKQMLNSTFGCCVTSIYHKEIELLESGFWDCKENKKGLLQTLEEYNNDKSRTLYYPWGVWVTAYGRSRLCKIIRMIDNDYLCSDTDSVKHRFPEKHIETFDEYNRWNEHKLQQAMKFHNLDYLENCAPKNEKGIRKILGNFENDGVYDTFKSLGAKRYSYIRDNKIHITVAGLNPIKGSEYLLDKYKDPQKIIEKFDDRLYVPALKTGKLTHTYIDREISGTITDYQGNTAIYYEKSCVNLSPCEFTLKLEKNYIDFLEDLKRYHYDLHAYEDFI